MWTKPYGMKEGFFIGGGLIIVGLLLQLCAGPVDWDVFRWPVNGIVLAVFLALIAIIYLLRKRMYGLQFIGTYKAAIPALVYAVVLTIIMGLTPQKSLIPGSSFPTGEGSMWIDYMLNFWPFVLIYVYVAVILGLIILRRAFHSPLSPLNLKRDVPFLLNHLGLFLAMTTATLGNTDMQRLKMITVKGEPEWRALTPQQQIVEMPITIELKEFVMETYDDGSPRRYASDIIITPRNPLTTQRSPLTSDIVAAVEVNKPVEVDGWKIYQYGYDTQMGAMSQISILELVSDPWLPLVYTGIYMMLAGAVCMFLFGGRKKVENRPINSKS